MNKELENILIKVGQLYNKYGIKSVTMDDVARELGMSKKTLYLHVENKNDLVSKVIDYFLDHKNTKFREILSKKQNAIEELLEVGIYIIKALRDFNPATEYDLKKYYPKVYDNLQNIRKERMYKSTLANIKKGKIEGLFREDLDEDIIAKFQTNRFLSMNTDDFYGTDEMLNPQFILELFIYHIRGIANEKGIEVLDKTLERIDIKDYLQ